ncbi:MAG: protein kinase domain-containing protein [Gemmatimonadaceae bacterium]
MQHPDSSGLSERLQHALGDSYRVERELTGAGMSHVFVVEELDLDRRIVVKVLPPDLSAGLSVERFRREIQLAARLQHPHIVPLLSAGAKDGLLYYAMPFIVGESLRARLARQHELPMQDAIRILRDVVDALSHAHANRIVHRDIKPDNVLLSGHHALVTDFGVSKALANATGESQLTSVGVALGTPAYMSPEQAVADPESDHRSDVYSVGVLGYELLTGRTPFSGMSAQQVLAAHVSTQPVPVTLHRDTVPPALAALIMRCLEKKPADRWQTADEMLAQLELLVSTSGASTPTGLFPHSRRPRRWVRIGVVFLGGAIIAAAAAWWQRRPPTPLVVESTTQVTNSTGLELDAAISPDGRLVAYAAGPIAHTRVFVRQLSGGVARALAESGGGAQRTPRWSPDGQQITFLVGQVLFAAPAFGGTARPLIDASGYEYASPTLSPDGATIAFAKQDGIYLRPTVGGEPVKLVAARWPSYLVWSPDGRRVAFVSDNVWYVYSSAMLGNIAPSTIWIADVARRSAVQVTGADYLNAAPTWLPDGRGLLYVSGQGGGRDIYQLSLDRSGHARGRPMRLTTGVNAHTLSISADGRRLSYTVLSTRSNVWWSPIAAPGSTTALPARSITEGNQTVEALAVSPDGKWIAFDSNQEGRQQIFKVSVEGGDPIQVTRDSADHFNPSWSGDGRFIAYHSLRHGNRDVYVTAADGTDARDVTGYPGHEMGPALSPDGRRVLFISDRSGRWELHAIERMANGVWSAPRQLTHDFGYRGRWSPDGRRIAYLSLIDTTLHVMDADGGGARLLFDGRKSGLVPLGAAFGHDPAIIYFAAIDSAGRYSFHAIPARGGMPRAVLTFEDPARQPRRPEFDTDGRRLFFTIASDEADVWMLQLAPR